MKKALVPGLILFIILLLHCLTQQELPMKIFLNIRAQETLSGWREPSD